MAKEVDQQIQDNTEQPMKTEHAWMVGTTFKLQ
jgi:hypothetical protein